VSELPLAVEEFLTWVAVERGRAPSTVAAYRRDLRRYAAWLHEHALDVEAVGEGEVVAYVRSLEAAGLAPASRARATVTVRSLHRYLAVEGVVDADAGADVAVPSVPAGLPKALTEAQVGALLDSVGGDRPVDRRDRAILEVLYGTGVRIAELVGLSLADVDLDAGLLRAFGKGRKERIVPLGRLARQSLESWLDPGGRPDLVPVRWARRGDAEAVFLNQRGGRLSRQGAWLVVRGRADDAGLGGLVWPHVLRHSCATHMLDRGADIRSVQELLGHASIATTQVYTKVTVERLRSAYDEAHPRARRSATPRSGDHR
jgi:integrase/recombinase XerD